MSGKRQQKSRSKIHVKEVTMELGKGGISQPRNAVIANVLYRLELFGSYGTGIQKMMESYAGSGAGICPRARILRCDPSQPEHCGNHRF